MDQWKEHVHLEIVDATFDEKRLLEITEALTTMNERQLIPQPVSDELFNAIDVVNERR